MTALERAWYRPGSWAVLLLPLSWLFRGIVALRRFWLESHVPRDFPLPVIVVGNITVGGTGKTPLIIALVKALQARGFRPGVISRGYGGRAEQYPLSVTADSDAGQCGDEPLLIAQSCACPVVVDPDRLRAARYLADQGHCDLILSDDGLQHYRLPRHLEIVVVDGERGLGNGHCLPAGPLREPPTRLREADFLVINGNGRGPDHPRRYRMKLEPLRFRHLGDGRTLEPKSPPGEGSVHAVAGIGNPSRFARTLASLGLSVRLHSWPDHHRFEPDDLVFADSRPVILTAKDGVKCEGFRDCDAWVLDVVARLEDNGLPELVNAIDNLV